MRSLQFARIGVLPFALWVTLMWQALGCEDDAANSADAGRGVAGAGGLLMGGAGQSMSNAGAGGSSRNGGIDGSAGAGGNGAQGGKAGSSNSDAGMSDANIAGDAPLLQCALTETYVFGGDGGNALYVHRMVVEPPATFTKRRVYRTNMPSLSCTVAIPPCTASARNVGDLVAALSHRDVQAAFTKSPPPFYGRDMRPVDGQAFFVQRGQAEQATQKFFVGGTCTGAAACVPAPPGIVALRAFLESLQMQLEADDKCAALAR